MKPAPQASVAVAGAGKRLIAPSAARNINPISFELQKLAPTSGNALELASGTGEHIAHFAALMPALYWQPSEIDPARRASIDAHAKDGGQTNIAPAIGLDAVQPGWGAHHSGQSLIFLSNLLHLISDKSTNVVINEAAQALNAQGQLVIYGPFMRDGILTSDGDTRFHNSLKSNDPTLGYKNDVAMIALMYSAGLTKTNIIEMPANNLILTARK